MLKRESCLGEKGKGEEGCKSTPSWFRKKTKTEVGVMSGSRPARSEEIWCQLSTAIIRAYRRKACFQKDYEEKNVSKKTRN